jgi:hypothetical protein
MAIDERSRHELYLRLEESLGPDAATTLMEHLPPVGWAEVATKRDLDLLKAEVLGGVRAELASQTRAMFVAIVTIVLTMSGLVLALAR